MCLKNFQQPNNCFFVAYFYGGNFQTSDVADLGYKKWLPNGADNVCKKSILMKSLVFETSNLI